MPPAEPRRDRGRPGGRGARRAGRGAARATAADATGLLGQEDRRRARASPRPAATRRSSRRRSTSRSTKRRCSACDRAEARLRLRVSAGFYVRSLAHDLGRQLGTGAHWGRSAGWVGPVRPRRCGVLGPGRHPEPGSASGGHPARASADRPACGPPRRRDHRPVRHGRQVVAPVPGWPGGRPRSACSTRTADWSAWPTPPAWLPAPVAALRTRNPRVLQPAIILG